MTQNNPMRTNGVDVLLASVDRLIDEGRFELAYQLVKGLRLLIGHRDELKQRLARIARALVPRWHFVMLNDRRRNKALARAIARLDLRGKIVLDIGAGTGLLSMLAAKEGAAHVYACEMCVPLADLAEAIIAKNGYEHRVTIIPKVSLDIKVGIDMPRADVLLSETIDCGFIGEGFLSSLRHARAELLRPDATLMPRAAVLYGALLDSGEAFGLNKVNDSVEGFQLGALNELSTQTYFPVRLSTRDHHLLSNPQPLIELDLAAYSFAPSDQNLALDVQRAGTVHGVVFWFDVQLVKGVSLTNDPRSGASHWMQAFACFERPIVVAQGDAVVVRFEFSERTVDITYQHTRTCSEK